MGAPVTVGGGGVLLSYAQQVDCTNKVAYLAYRVTSTGVSRQSWKCVTKPRIIPPNGDHPGPCPSDCIYLQALHSTCYSSTQQCTGLEQKVYLTTIQEKEYAGTFGGDAVLIISGKTNKYAQASCGRENIGKKVCWSPHAPVHISDGGGPTDQVREAEIEAALKTPVAIHYHRLQENPEEPEEGMVKGLQFSRRRQPESWCLRQWKHLRAKCRPKL
ncbi:uncharacterized protein LOC141508610 [Macrotis lagotis]|uniref:uncharacterized protein LOC141508610 n=1 Tax=Macrotis lagotis TaxID=92651 RepID=UPI003D694138